MRAADFSAADRRAARHAAFRGRLLEAVISLLSDERSYAELTVEEIASAAGTSRSTFYLHFRDKGQLLAEFVSDLTLDMIEATWWTGAAPTRPTLREHLATLVLLHRSNAGLMVAAADAAAFDPAVREAYLGVVQSARSSFTDHLRRGRAEGWVHTDTDPDALAGWLTWMAERGLAQLLPGSDEQQVEDLIDSLTQIVWASLYQAGPNP